MSEMQADDSGFVFRLSAPALAQPSPVEPAGLLHPSGFHPTPSFP